ncbi:MAG: GntR family transcriptional regulator, transcriptional repressor for pyruvate dehydrogenase complex [Acidimicrobiaceae bacterium]|jgi:DNA-binding FadR family transcriptional regulator|nr:GntR family transcriptional regulator, transcriptional repressor for pyruvate dehydrogenase complex [Acidimicrobiaceae bacterium]
MLPPEAVMLEKYGVGRASLREALRVLEVQGLIVIKPGPGGGPMVAGVSAPHFGKMATLYFQLSGAAFRDLLQARLVIEPVMARLAAERRAPAHMARLRAFLIEPGPTAGVQEANVFMVATEFHAMVAGMSENPVLDLFARAIKAIYTERQHGGAFPEDARERVVHDHVAIAQAILDGDADRAELLMRSHMVEFAEFSAVRYPGMMEEPVDWR